MSPVRSEKNCVPTVRKFTIIYHFKQQVRKQFGGGERGSLQTRTELGWDLWMSLPISKILATRLLNF